MPIAFRSNYKRAKWALLIAGACVSLAALAAIAVLMASAAGAADLPRKAPLAQPAPYVTMSWGGFYVGPKFAYGLTAPFSGPGGGVQLGYDWYANGVVIGLVGDISAANFSGTTVTGGPVAAWNSRTNWYGTEDVRLGLPIGPALIYGMAGVAEGGRTMNVTGGPAFGNVGFGWNGGGGVEWKISQTTSLFTQFKHIDIGNVTDPTTGIRQKFNPDVWETGINFHW